MVVHDDTCYNPDGRLVISATTQGQNNCQTATTKAACKGLKFRVLWPILIICGTTF